MAWLDFGDTGESGSLPRDLSLDPETGELLQSFSPELQGLRNSSVPRGGLGAKGLQLEVFAQFSVAQGGVGPPYHAEFGLKLDGVDAQTALSSEGSSNSSSWGGEGVRVGIVSRTGLVVAGGRAGPLLPLPPLAGAPPLPVVMVSVHLILDHSILTVIVNNRTAITLTVLPTESDSSSRGLELYGVGVGVGVLCTNLQTWTLRDANITYAPRKF